MKKKLIAIVISALFTGGIGSILVYKHNSNKNTYSEVSQVSDEGNRTLDENEDIISNNIEDSSESDSSNMIESKENPENVVSNNIALYDNNTVSNEVLLQNDIVQAPQNNNNEKVEKVKNENVHVDTNAGNVSSESNVTVQNNADNFISQVEQLIYNKVNEQRSANGLEKLSYNTVMQKYARIKSQDMGDNNYFDHEDLNGRLITDKMKNDGVKYNAWGENIAYISGISDPNVLADKFMSNWMNSKGHRENILSQNFSSIGIGVYKIGNKVYASQEFYR